MARYLFSSHDGFGVGHLRRNTLIAAAILRSEPDADVGIVTGVAARPAWLRDERLQVTLVPPLVKDSDGAYRNDVLSFEESIERRAQIFDGTVAGFRPDVVIVDRHPYGVAGELLPGLLRAREVGAALVLGLRDVLDEPAVIAAELAGAGWADVGKRFDAVLVYGSADFCDHVREYGLSVQPDYCGWVVEDVEPRRRDPHLLVVTAGGGGDGEAVFKLGVELVRQLPQLRGVLVAGPYAATAARLVASAGVGSSRLRFVRDHPGCIGLFAEAGSIVQMAGYNSTLESLAAGIRPVLVPRRSPRREQAIRASRLTALGLADVVDEAAPAEEVEWLLRRPRQLRDGAVEAAGIRLDGAEQAARRLQALAQQAVR